MLIFDCWEQLLQSMNDSRASDLDDKSILWKFLSIEKFLSFIFSRKLHFTRLDMFEDAREGTNFTQLLFEHTKNALSSLPPFNSIEHFSIDFFPTESDQLSESFKEQQRLRFVNCWYASKGKIESLAMWKLYSHMNSVAIKIPYQELKNRFDSNKYNTSIEPQSFKMDMVRYVDFQNTDEIQKASESWEVGSL